MFCKLCCKHFSTANAFANHLNSKKHKELSEAAVSGRIQEESDVNVDNFAVKSDRNAKREQAAAAMLAEIAALKASTDESMEHVEAMEGDEKDWEDMDDEDMDQFGSSSFLE